MSAAEIALMHTFVERVEQLSPADWGRLDAIGMADEGLSPMAAMKRAERVTLVLRSVMRKPTILESIVSSFVTLLTVFSDPSSPERAHIPAQLPESTDAKARTILEGLRALRRIAEAQAGGARSGLRVVEAGLMYLSMKSSLEDSVIERLWEPLERVIPFATLHELKLLRAGAE